MVFSCSFEPNPVTDFVGGIEGIVQEILDIIPRVVSTSFLNFSINFGVSNMNSVIHIIKKEPVFFDDLSILCFYISLKVLSLWTLFSVFLALQEVIEGILNVREVGILLDSSIYNIFSNSFIIILIGIWRHVKSVVEKGFRPFDLFSDVIFRGKDSSIYFFIDRFISFIYVWGGRDRMVRSFVGGHLCQQPTFSNFNIHIFSVSIGTFMMVRFS